MYDVQFNLNSMQILLKDCLTTENTLKESANGLCELSNGIRSEILSFDSESHREISEIDNKIATVKSMIDNAETKKASAKSMIKQELPTPPPPSIPANATAEEQRAIVNAHQKKVRQVEIANFQIRSDNARIDTFTRECDSTIAKLKEIISRLHEIKFSIEKERLHVLSEAKGYTYKIPDDIRSLKLVQEAMKQFFSSYNSTLEDAVAIATLTPSKIEPYYYADKQFEIKNQHGRVFGSYVASFRNSSETTSTSSSTSTLDTLSADDEILINDREEFSFFDKAKNVSKIKMPSANLHKLGGKAFIAKMKARGFSLQTLSNGNVIDDSGMMHWEKQDE